MISPFPICHWSAGGTVARFPGLQDPVSDTPYLFRTTDLVGNANGQKALIFFRIKITGADSITLPIYVSGRDIPGNQDLNDLTRECLIYRNSANRIFIGFDKVGGGSTFLQSSTQDFTVSETWKNVLIAWDYSVPSHKLYLEETDLTSGAASVVTVRYLQDFHMVGIDTDPSIAGGSHADFCIADFYINFEETLDITIAANRRKFYGEDGQWIDLGVNGETPTGNSPLMYFRGVAADFPTNVGDGGAFTLNDSLEICNTNPIGF